MEEQLVTFDTAKLAKEKGFDSNTRMMYSDDELQGVKLDMHGNANNFIDKYSAPTQSSLQAWLRKEHNIIIYSRPFIDYDNNVDNIIYKYIIWNGATEGNYKTYEEALENSFQEALKLIK